MDQQKRSPALNTETARVRDIYERMAPRYDRMLAIAERLLFSGVRRWACGQAMGEVLEVAIGTGRDLPWYPSDVKLVGIDLTPQMLDAARVRANMLFQPVALQVADAQQLPFGPASNDSVRN